VYLPPLILSWW